ncbi:MAG TPA: type II toxin-antitoxin system prevent-host-death family antitoxin [Longimicrobiales bacterium]|nr:type II toxin-antitoxin system prevent-host-death family antitoxin [Longimicrobiales bacterium]
MRAVGIRELKNKLSHYVRLVEAGESVLVTDRGTVVAELRPPDHGGQRGPTDPIEAELAAMARRGRAVLGARHDPQIYDARRRALPKGASARGLLDAERGPR